MVEIIVYFGIPTRFDASFNEKTVEKEFFCVGTLILGLVIAPLLIMSQILNDGRTKGPFFVSNIKFMQSLHFFS